MRKLVERRASILPIQSKMRLRILQEDQIKKIHEATLGILEDVGVSFPSEKALRIFADAGAKVDFGTRIVKLDSDLVMKSVKKDTQGKVVTVGKGEFIVASMNTVTSCTWL